MRRRPQVDFKKRKKYWGQVNYGKHCSACRNMSEKGCTVCQWCGGKV